MADWHPILAAVEGPTGTWRLVDPQGREYGRVELRRVRTRRADAAPPASDAVIPQPEHVARYRAVWGDELLGWATTLRHACERVHGAYVRAHGPVPFAGYPDLRPRGAEVDEFAAHRHRGSR